MPNPAPPAPIFSIMIPDVRYARVLNILLERGLNRGAQSGHEYTEEEGDWCADLALRLAAYAQANGA